ncbi:MAG: T9SS type A sorting domain-containing protein, partial [Emticicia sp.]|uniref:T9SS type A sorting domain-containing protein n=1 Tax=Emticicia sp. TaxID=1930953 RepID=UPI003BA4664F
SGGKLSNLGYIFNFKDGDSLKFQTQTSITVSKPGTYWVMQGGNEKGQTYITCKSFEVIQPEQPDVISSVNNKTVTVRFLATAKNQKHGSYRILWGDGSIDFIQGLKINSFPFEKSHTYTSNPTNQPLIVAIYTRGNIETCQSPPYPIQVEIEMESYISSLTQPNEKSVVLTLSNGDDKKVYEIENKNKDGIWKNTGKKINPLKNNSITTYQIDSLESNIQCFRLKYIDNAGKEKTTNEVCLLKLNATYISDKEIKLNWNNTDSTNSKSFELKYRTKEDTQTKFINVDKKTEYLFSQAQPNKKYKFSVSRTEESSEGSVYISSPEVLYIPNGFTEEIPVPDNLSSVSTLDSKTIRFNFYESSFLKSKYHFYRSISGQDFIKIGESVQNFFEDKNIDTNKDFYCYALKYEDEWATISNLSINNPCTIKLSIENNELKWNPALLNNKSLIEVEYSIDLLDEGEKVLRSPLENINETFYDISPAFLFGKNKIFNFIVRGTMRYKISTNGSLVSFPIQVYSNTVTYSPILSTSKEADKFTIYPNPSEDFVQLNSTLQLKTVEIVDLQGKIIENQTIENGQVSVKHLLKGKYILRLYGNDKKLISSKAIIKM